MSDPQNEPKSEAQNEPLSDPRDEPAPLGAVVLLTVASAVAVMVVTSLIDEPPGLKLLLFGPIALVAFEVVVHEVWWQRWWGAVPGAVLGLTLYSEGREALGDMVGDAWGHPIAYVAAWALFAVVFAVASRYPRTLAT